MEKNTVKNFEVPKEINFEIKDNSVKMQFDNKEIIKKFNTNILKLQKEGTKIIIKVDKKRRKGLSVANTIHSKLKNMVIGLQKGFSYKLIAVYSHFPMNIQIKENKIEISNFAGEKNKRIADIIGSTKIQIKGKEIILEGIDKEDVSLTAANIENKSRIKNKDNREFQDGIYLVSKGVKNG